MSMRGNRKVLREKVIGEVLSVEVAVEMALNRLVRWRS